MAGAYVAQYRTRIVLPSGRYVAREPLLIRIEYGRSVEFKEIPAGREFNVQKPATEAREVAVMYDHKNGKVPAFERVQS